MAIEVIGDWRSRWGRNRRRALIADCFREQQLGLDLGDDTKANEFPRLGLLTSGGRAGRLALLFKSSDARVYALFTAKRGGGFIIHRIHPTAYVLLAAENLIESGELSAFADYVAYKLDEKEALRSGQKKRHRVFYKSYSRAKKRSLSRFEAALFHKFCEKEAKILPKIELDSLNYLKKSSISYKI
ncbi:MAG: hypothetical protein Q4P72_00195 [Eubacteriales bacterium]|nr:hypothetical protein [Eubacteriales bacterium]